ncbi:CsbD family protein [Patulibacter americanus]|uniref:CsbD family protein n=1 Tax=Patulibacter americanus TaxID=588672 RepID=UPI0003B4A98B|nr:CsbD family protein [Patulibacter americanus]
MTDGKTDKLKGQVKETAGAATDNDELRNEGRTDQNAGKVKDKVGDAVDGVKDKLTGK